MSEQDIPGTTNTITSNLFPLLPLRDVVVFPHMVIPLFVGRSKSIKALETAMEAWQEHRAGCAEICYQGRSWYG